MVLVHHIGAKTGTERVTPLMTQVDGGTRYVFASKAGAPDNPDWYHNLRATPRVMIEVPATDAVETVEVEAIELTGDERDRVW